MTTDFKVTNRNDEDYPERLKNIPDPPENLYYRGRLPKRREPAVAIVGSRGPTAYGISMAEYFAQALASEGVGIISGMALGIDAAAHRGALKAEGGKTYAVLGTGINICYPARNFDIYDALVTGERGGILSEYNPDEPALSWHFPVRNLIISGLSDAVLVIEAREKSGSLITADQALEQGRDVLAVPGRITDPLSRGCNRLISSGAAIVTSPEDVMQILGLLCGGIMKMPEKNINILARNEKLVYSTLDLSPKHTQEIVQETGLPFQDVVGILLDLELRGYITQISSNYYGIR